MSGVRIFPCYRCPAAEGCPERHVWKKKLGLLGLRSAAFVCARLTGELRPGRRVVITAPYRWMPDTPEEDVGHKEVNGTIVRPDAAQLRRRPHLVQILVDPGEITRVELLRDDIDPERVRFRKAMPHYRIVRFLDEPDVSLAPCGHVVRDGKCDELLGEGELSCNQLSEAEREAHYFAEQHQRSGT